MSLMKIKATDPLFFRTGRPFNMGVDSWTDSSILPNPSVIWGAIFSTMMSQNNELKEGILSGKITNPEDYLSIKNIYLYNEDDGTVLLPAPLDLYVDENGKLVTERYEEVDSSLVVSTDYKILSFPKSSKNCKRISNKFIRVDSLGEDYHKKNCDFIFLYDFDEVFLSDLKVGIAIDKRSKTSKESCLYRIDLTQLKEKWSFLVEYEIENSKFNLDKSGFLKLGGEGKIAYYQIISDNLDIDCIKNYRNNVTKSGNYIGFKIILTSPACFEDRENISANIYTSSVGKPISVGGFDVFKKIPKFMYRYAPPGSVYIVDKNIKIDEISQLMGFNAEMSLKGFNQFIVVPI